MRGEGGGQEWSGVSWQAILDRIFLFETYNSAFFPSFRSPLVFSLLPFGFHPPATRQALDGPRKEAEAWVSGEAERLEMQPRPRRLESEAGLGGVTTLHGAQTGGEMIVFWFPKRRCLDRNDSALWVLCVIGLEEKYVFFGGRCLLLIQGVRS